MDKLDNQIGFLKYRGKLVEDGFLDTRKSAQALLGFDEAIRFFISQQIPTLKNKDFDFPVRIRKGSWEISVVDILKIAGGAYLLKAAHKMADNDFEGIGLKEVFKNSIRGIQWIIKIGKHLGDLAIKELINLTYKDNNELIGIRNDKGEVLFVPRRYLKWYVASSPFILSKVSDLVEADRELSIGVYENGIISEEKINYQSKQIFIEEKKENEVMFPELIHDQEVELVGEITRGNEITNTLGLNYDGHILNCAPEKGSVVRFKDTLFLNCRMHGRVCRIDENGFIAAKKPKIIFHHIEPLEAENPELPIF